jgi:hypothetical protein
MLIFISSMASLKRERGLPSLDDQDLELLFNEVEGEDEDVTVVDERVNQQLLDEGVNLAGVLEDYADQLEGGM